MRSPTGSSEQSITKSENLATATETCRPRQPVLIYSTPLVMPQIAKCRIANGTEPNVLKRIFANKGNVKKVWGTSSLTRIVLLSAIKPISSSNSARKR